MTTLKVAATEAVNDATRFANSLPEAQAALAAVDPRLAASMSTKFLAASKSPWIITAAPLAVAALTHYGFAMDVPTMVSLMALATLVASFVMRYVSTSYISGIFKVPGPTVTVGTVPAPPAVAPAPPSIPVSVVGSTGSAS